MVPIYRDQYVNIDTFLGEFNQLLEHLIIQNAFLLSDFNIHWDTIESDAIKLKIY